MNIQPIQQPGAMPMGQMPQPTGPQLAPNPQQAQQQVQQQQAQQQQQTQEKFDNISKVKSLVIPLRESLAITLKTAANTLTQNSLVDNGSSKESKGTDSSDHRFNKNMEEFYSICDQIELHLKTSIECLSQNSSSVRYLPMSVIPTRTENVSAQEGPALTYPQFLMTVKAQVAYARDVHDTLLSAAHTIAPGE